MALRKKLFTTTTLAVALGAFGVFASAQTTEAPKADGTKAEKHERRGGRGGEFGKRGFGKRGGMRHGGHRMGFLRGIELTDAQKEQIKAIHEANKPTGENKALFDQIRETRKAGGTITEEQKAQLKSLRDAQKAKMQGVHEQVLAVLTPEQKAQIEAKKAEMKTRMEQRRQLRQQKKAEAKPATVN